MFSKRDLWRILIYMVCITILCVGFSAVISYKIGCTKGKNDYWGVPGGLSDMEESVEYRMYPLSTNYVWLGRGGDQRIILVISGIADWSKKYSKYTVIKEGSYLVPLIPGVRDRTPFSFRLR